MMNLILGRTGSGKTATVIREIKAHLEEKEQPVFFIVPEQQLYSVERELLSTLPSHAAQHLTLTSFTKLCDTLEDLYGGRAHTVLTNAASALLMWLNLRELSGTLETYGAVPTGDLALTRKMLETAKELNGNGISPQRLETVSRTLESQSPLSCKLRDISLIMTSYHHLVEEICGNNPADRLLRAAEQVRKHRYFENAVIYVDSFTSFTAQEYTLLSLMISQAAQVHLTLGLDDPMNHEPQFDSLRETYRRLSGMVIALGVEKKITRLTRAADGSELGLLERTLWDFSAAPHSVSPEKQGHIHMVTAANPYEEAEATALHILELVQQGISYNEIAVVVRDMSQWRGILDVALEQYHIPYFLSEKTDLNTKPAARLLLMALRCISRHYQIHDIMALCKTGLCHVAPRDMDYFEEYTTTWHLSGKRMTEAAWSMNPDGYTADWSERGQAILTAANRVREAVMTPLLSLEVKLKGAETVTDQCRALYEYLCDLSLKEQLSAQGKTFLSLGNVREAGETVRLFTFINEALVTIASVTSVMPDGGAPLTAEELSGALSLIYAETDIGSVPARHDCVMVGTADTLRVDNIKASLIPGLCEGEFPRAISDSGLLSEHDKAILADNGIEFSSREALMTSEELLYVYRAMTKPQEQLYLSRSLSRTDGKALSPSAAFTRVSYLFPHIKILPFSSRYLSETASSVYVPAVDDQLSPPRAYALLGEETWLSRSKLQRYAYCPYSYFGSFVLHLREKITAKIDNLTSGLFLHHVLETYLRHAMDETGHLVALTQEEMQKAADDIMEAYIRALNQDPELHKQGRFLHTFDRLRAIALVLLGDISTELSQGSFLPVGFEWDTHGFKEGDPSPLILPLHEASEDAADRPVGIDVGAPVRLKMGGVIDRVDVFRTDDGKKVYIRVVDYKSSKHTLSEKTMTEDMDVQLLLYLFTLCAPQNRHLFADENGQIPESVLPAQAMYLSPKEDSDTGAITAVRTGLLLEDDTVIRAASHDLDPAYLPSGIKITKDGTMSGNALCSSERLEALESLLHETIRHHAQNMYSGVACRTPSSDGCAYCPLREGCPLAAEKSVY